jgi:hypothetical protein
MPSAAGSPAGSAWSSAEPHAETSTESSGAAASAVPQIHTECTWATISPTAIKTLKEPSAPSWTA